MADGKTFAARNPNDPAALIRDTQQVLSWGQGRTWYLPKQVKLLTDGAIYSQLMMMKDGYTDGHHGAWIMDPPVFGYAFQSYWDAGYQIHIHNNGDAGMDVLLGELEKAMARNPRTDHRTVLVHFGFASPEQVAKWIKLGGIVSANPYYVTALAGRYAKLGVGPERSANMVPLGDVIKNNGSLSFHSDMPMAPAKPLQLVWAAVNRNTAEGPVMGSAAQGFGRRSAQGSNDRRRLFNSAGEEGRFDRGRQGCEPDHPRSESLCGGAPKSEGHQGLGHDA